MGIMVYSLLWVVQDFVHQPYLSWAHGPLALALPTLTVLLCRGSPYRPCDPSKLNS